VENSQTIPLGFGGVRRAATVTLRDEEEKRTEQGTCMGKAFNQKLEKKTKR